MYVWFTSQALNLLSNIMPQLAQAEKLQGVGELVLIFLKKITMNSSAKLQISSSIESTDLDRYKWELQQNIA